MDTLREEFSTAPEVENFPIDSHSRLHFYDIFSLTICFVQMVDQIIVLSTSTFLIADSLHGESQYHSQVSLYDF